MTYTNLFLNLTIASSFLCQDGQALNHKKRTQPNILLINVDDLGWNNVGFMGSEYYETPNLDKLAADGMIFTNAYVAAANSAPSRACLMSGQWTPRHGIYTVDESNRGEIKAQKLIPTPNTTVLSDTVYTMANALKDAGYYTCHIGKWHLSDDPIKHGFDMNIGGNHEGNPLSYYAPFKNIPLEAPEGYYLTNLIMDKTLEFIQSAKEKPFFLNYAPYAVHTPFHPVKALLKKYENKPPWNGHDHAKYATMIENLDTQIGRLITVLKETGQLENTFILFTSDNGGRYATTKQWPLRSGKGAYYEGGIRVPMFAYWKGKIKGGVKSDVPVTHIDFYPTFLEIAGTKKPNSKTLDGQSLLPLFTTEKTLEERPLFWHFPVYLNTQVGGGDYSATDRLFRTRPGSAVRMGDWKLIQYFENNDLELYNLSEDIGEKNNIAQMNSKKTQELLELLQEWRRKTNAPVPTELNPEYICN